MKRPLLERAHQSCRHILPASADANRTARSCPLDHLVCALFGTLCKELWGVSTGSQERIQQDVELSEGADFVLGFFFLRRPCGIS